jgi:hypothetical protein
MNINFGMNIITGILHADTDSDTYKTPRNFAELLMGTEEQTEYLTDIVGLSGPLFLSNLPSTIYSLRMGVS